MPVRVTQMQHLWDLIIYMKKLLDLAKEFILVGSQPFQRRRNWAKVVGLCKAVAKVNIHPNHLQRRGNEA
jgi:hypothetical protein